MLRATGEELDETFAGSEQTDVGLSSVAAKKRNACSSGAGGSKILG
jgi:hypothetical protein